MKPNSLSVQSRNLHFKLIPKAAVFCLLLYYIFVLHLHMGGDMCFVLTCDASACVCVRADCRPALARIRREGRQVIAYLTSIDVPQQPVDHEPPPVLIPKSERERERTEGRLLGEEVSGDRLGFVVCRFEGICGFWGEETGGRPVSLSWITSAVLVIKGTVHPKHKFCHHLLQVWNEMSVSK